MSQHSTDFKSYMGYARLGNESDYHIQNMIFSCSTQETFTVGTTPSCDLILPEIEKMKPIPQAVLYVNEKGKVSIENISKAASFESLKVGGVVLQMNEKRLLSGITSIDFGGYRYTFEYWNPPTARYIKRLFDLAVCGWCRKVLKNPVELRCGHWMCKRCVIVQIKDRSISFIEHSDVAEVFRRQVEEMLDVQANCPECQQRYLPIELNSIGVQKSFETILKPLRSLAEDHLVCKSCRNIRLLVHYCDYVRCENCRSDLCPLCAIEFHQGHKLRNCYLNMARKLLQFNKLCQPVKQRYVEMIKKRSEIETLYSTTLRSLESCVYLVSSLDVKVDSEKLSVQELFERLDLLSNGRRWNEKMEEKCSEQFTSLTSNILKKIDDSKRLASELKSKSKIVSDTLHRRIAGGSVEKIAEPTEEHSLLLLKSASPVSSNTPADKTSPSPTSFDSLIDLD